MSIKNKLNRLKSHIVQDEKRPDEVLLQEKITVEEIPFEVEWAKEGVFPYYFEGNYCLVREKEYPLEQKHGMYSFAHFLKAVEEWNSTNIQHPLSAAGYRPEDLFFFDTETTGLGGGVGNTIFLLGHASLTGNSIKLKQHLLPHPGGEIPLYKSFLDSINYSTMVTYNGKAFDWPQVKTRHTLIREHVPKLPPFGHFDLYHASRRMWKHKLDRLKLSIVEKEVLGIERKDDIPGFLAPMIYFDFIERKDPEGMLGIMKHNEIDILSLISLYTHLSFQLLGLDQKQTNREVYEAGRWFATIGESAAAKKAFTQVAHGEAEDAQLAKHALAFEFKRNKNWPEAIQLWESVVEKGNLADRLEAAVELAKIYEHRQKDLVKAHYYSERAENLFQEIQAKQTVKSRIKQEEIEKRLKRLGKKINTMF